MPRRGRANFPWCHQVQYNTNRYAKRLLILNHLYLHLPASSRALFEIKKPTATIDFIGVSSADILPSKTRKKQRKITVVYQNWSCNVITSCYSLVYNYLLNNGQWRFDTHSSDKAYLIHVPCNIVMDHQFSCSPPLVGCSCQTAPEPQNTTHITTKREIYITAHLISKFNLSV